MALSVSRGEGTGYRGKRAGGARPLAARWRVGWRAVLAWATGVLAAAPAVAQAPDWQWPGRPTAAEEPCLAAAPAAALDVYVADYDRRAGTHDFWTCDPPGAGPVAIVLSRLRFPKDLGFPLPTLDIAVDHIRRDYRRADGRYRHDGFASGNAACRSLIDGACRTSMAPDDAGWRFTRVDGGGPSVDRVPAGAVPDDFWDPSVVRADRVVNFYTGHVWRITPDPTGTPDPVQGRPATRYRLISEEKGFPLFTSRFDHILWFTAEGDLLRVCAYEQDLGFSHVAELVRRDLGIARQGDCARWFD